MSDQGFVDANGTSIHYKRAGKGIPVILLHGTGISDIRDWDNGLCERISQTNHVIAFDRPGIGKSERPHGAEDLKVQAATLKAAAQMLGIYMPILIGHSYGAAVAMSWATQASKDVTGLMVLSAPLYLEPSNPGILLNLLKSPVTGPALMLFVCKYMRKNVVSKEVKKVFSPDSVPDTFMAQIGDYMLRDPIVTRNGICEMLAITQYLPELRTKLDTLTMPVEILHGTEDKSADPTLHSDKLAKAIPHSHYTLLADTGHMPHYTAQDQLIEALARINQQAT